MRHRTAALALLLFLLPAYFHQSVLCQSVKGEPIVHPAYSLKTGYVALAKKSDITTGEHFSESSGIFLSSSVGSAYAAVENNVPDPSEDSVEKEKPAAGEETGNSLPAQYALFQNFPNPFNPTTVIRYALPVQAIVTLKVYDVIGREVATPLNGFAQNAGYFSVAFNGSNLASGLYYYKLTAGAFTDVKKMMLVK